MTDLATRASRPAPAPTPSVPRPAPRRFEPVWLDTDLAAAVGALVACTLGMWVVHGGLTALAGGASAAWTSLAQVTGLLASAAGLLGLVLVARLRRLERLAGLDRLFIWHRVLGETTAVLVGAHVATSLVAWSVPPGSPLDAVAQLTGREPYMAAATVGALLVGVVTVSSLRTVRHHLSYETWYLVHLTAYLGLALAFSHQITLGGDLADDRVARAVWVVLHLGVVGMLVWDRWGRLVQSYLHPLRVLELRDEAAGTRSLQLGGRHLDRHRASAGQFFMLRALRPRLWWQPHPFSLSAAPTDRSLRFTIKDRGDASAALLRLPVGSAVAVEGPYGAMTGAVLDDRRALFVAGGIGIAPVRALLEELGPGSQPVVLYRAHSHDDLPHLAELQRLAAERGGTVFTLVGPTLALADQDPFAPAGLRALVPDLAERVAVLCGPERLLHAARRGLIEAGLPSARIHFERPWW